MPLNEAGARRSNLTKQQIREAELAILGYQEQAPLSLNNEYRNYIAQAEIARMRELLAAHDRQSDPNETREFDLNNPPRKPYTYQEYPRCMYHEDGRTRNAANAEEMNAAIAAGWHTTPVLTVEVIDPWRGGEPAADAEAPETPETPKRKGK